MSHRFNLNRFNGNRFNIHPVKGILAAFLILAIGPALGAGIPAVAADTSSEESTPSAIPAALPGTDGTQPPTGASVEVPADAPQPTAAVTSTRQIVLELGRRTISLLEDGKVQGSWPVAIGDPKTPTPVGTYKIENKIVNPQYQSTKSGKINPTIGPNGPLGDRWIGFHSLGRDQFGIHGTPSAWSWTVTGRTAVTNGCVRMLTPHVRQLFDQVEVGTPVLVKR